MATDRRTPWLEVCLAALPAALHALVFLGRLHPDELFQTLEVGLRHAFGYGVVPWEWQVPARPELATQPWGIRNWSIPLLFSALFRIGAWLGLDSALARRSLAELPQWLLHVAMLGAVYRMAARRAGAQLARGCLWLVALYGPVVWFSGRPMSESFSSAFLVWGLERLDDEEGGAPDWAWGGALLGLAQVTRYGSAAAILPAMAWLLVQRRVRPFAFAAGGGLLVALALGLLDRVTWGAWFHSLIDYVRFNLVSGQAAAKFGSAPAWYYLPRLLVAPFAVVGLVAGWRQGRRPSLFIAAAVGYFAIVSATAHKEDRFLYPVLVLLTVSGAPLFATWVGDGTALRRKAVGVVVAAAGALFFALPTPFDVQRKEQFQLAAKAGQGATGFVLMNEGLWGSPGFFYLGHNVPWCACDFPTDPCFQQAARDLRVNRAVYWSNGGPAEVARDQSSEQAFTSAGFRVVERRGRATLFER